MSEALVLSRKDTKEIHRAIAMTWYDSAFREKLLSSPKEVLSALGIAVSRWIDVVITPDSNVDCIVEIQDGKLNINLPSIPRNLNDSILAFNDIDVAFSIKLCCTCLEVDKGQD